MQRDIFNGLKGTKVANNYYNLTSIPSGTTAVTYTKKDPTLTVSENRAFNLWFNFNNKYDPNKIIDDNVFESYNVNYRDSPLGVITILNEAEIIPVVLSTKCCGHDNYWAGDSATARKLAEYNIKLYRDAGVKTIIVDCAEGYRMWKIEYPKMFPDLEFEVIHFTNYVTDNQLTKLLVPDFPVNVKVTYHDPCRLGRLGGGIYEPPRKILESIPGVELVEMENIKENANCCGVSGFKCCNSNTKTLREARVDEAIATGAEYLITTCPKCVTHFSCYLSEKDMDGNINPKSEKLKIMELSAFIAKITQKI